MNSPTKDIRLETMPWRASADWYGESIPGYEGFDFSTLPWIRARQEEQVVDGVECVKASNSRRVLRLHAPDDSPDHGRVVYAKRYLTNTFRRKIALTLAGPRTKREFHLGMNLLRAGISTPQPLAWAAHAKPLPRGKHTSTPPASYLLTLEWENDGSVRDFLLKQSPDLRNLFARLASFLAESHDRGFYHDDCSTDHILVRVADPGESEAPAYDLAFIDVDNGRMGSSPLAFGRRVSNLFQIFRSMPSECVDAEARKSLVEHYVDSLRMGKKPTVGEIVARIDRFSMKKVGRRVVEL